MTRAPIGQGVGAPADAGRATAASQSNPSVSSKAGIPSAGWVVVTYYRELQAWLTPYEELRRSRVYRWRWLARLLSYSGPSFLKVDGRYYFSYDAIVPAAALKGDQP